MNRLKPLKTEVLRYLPEFVVRSGYGFDCAGYRITVKFRRITVSVAVLAICPLSRIGKFCVMSSPALPSDATIAELLPQLWASQLCAPADNPNVTRPLNPSS